MVTRAKLIISGLLAATAVGAVTAASAATTETTGCVTPRLVGVTDSAAVHRARAAGCAVHLAGAVLKLARVQTVAAQAPAPGTASVNHVVRLTLNPLCFGEALSGPPHNQSIRPGPTELITGLYIVGGPALPYSTPRCRQKPGRPTTGTIDVLDASDETLIASRTITRARLVTFSLAPGSYRVSGRVGGRQEAQIIAQPFSIRAGDTTRRYVIEPVP